MMLRDQTQLERRTVLRGILTGTSAALVTAAAPAALAAAPPDQGTGKDAGYRETDHVRRAYDAARF